MVSFSFKIDTNGKGTKMASREQRRQKKVKKDVELKLKTGGGRKKNRTLSTFGIIILFVIVITFIGGPLLSGSVGSGKLIFGSFAGVEIEDYPGNYFNRQREVLAGQVASSVESDNLQYQAYQIWRGAFDRTVLHTAILLDAEKSGLHISEQRIDLALTQTGPYMDNGEFSEKRYNDASNSEKFLTRKLYNEELVHEQYINDVLSGLRISSKEADFIKSIAENEKSFNYIAYPFNTYPKEEITIFGSENQDLFRTINLSRITIKSGKTDAENIKEQLTEDGTLFADLAISHSKDTYAFNGGEMGLTAFHTLKADFSDEDELNNIFNMKKDQISSVIETDFGWVIYKCNEESLNPDFTDDTVITDIRSYINRYEKGKIEDFFTQKGTDFAVAAVTTNFTDASSDLDLVLHTTDYFPINYGNIDLSTQYGSYPFFKAIKTLDGSTILDSASNDEYFLKKIFSLDTDSVSEPLILSEHVIVVQLLDERPTSEEDLSLIDLIYPSAVSQYHESALANLILSSDQLEDNFYEVFSQLYDSSL